MSSSSMTLSFDNPYIRQYISCHKLTSPDFTVFEEYSVCKICLLTKRLIDLDHENTFKDWYILFSYRAAFLPIFNRISACYAGLFWEKCCDVLNKSELTEEVRTSLKTIVLNDILKPVDFMYHFVIKTCLLNSSEFSKNITERTILYHIGLMLKHINSVAFTETQKENNIISMVAEAHESEILSGTSTRYITTNESHTLSNSNITPEKSITKQDIHYFLTYLIKDTPCFKSNLCNSTNRDAYLKLRHELLTSDPTDLILYDPAKVNRKHVETVDEKNCLKEVICICSSAEFKGLGIIQDCRVSEKCNIIDNQAIDAFDSILQNKALMHKNTESYQLKEECFLCTLYHFPKWYDFLENVLWFDVNKRRNMFSKMNMPIYEIFNECRLSADDTHFQQLIFQQLNADHLYKHFITNPSCALNRCKMIGYYDGVIKTNLRCLFSLAEVILYKLIQRVHHDINLDLNSRILQQFISLLEKHNVIHDKNIAAYLDVF